ncbi:MAG: Trk system potassium transporter TrkA [Waddliaceae bacterium]|nr:Trk system potassium transporter TrkA [Waddliaceae bacterium]MBT3579641.1 Trk system potassium transporter TrkA [Waddliaceae bacterium]MBT4445226.1 Trk system potassium transporter TrkA [Waddliaceae bacterium]MBT6928114.1 Trk system potassium transporter TrkA [Waddliaceae bacterium]MBT7264675.1 Trk system potassium transporter TrkA [Waddliaceae bacterium]
MNIVIVGAGDVGSHVATFLSRKENNITVVDINAHCLEDIVQNVDVAVRVGSGTDWQILEDLKEMSPDILFALTDSDETNLITCSIAKNLGYPKTVARIRKSSYLNKARLDFGRLFCVDHFICPELLVAHDIFNYALESGTVAVENFAHGAVQMRTVKVPMTWRKGDTSLCELDLPKKLVISLIMRTTTSVTKGKERVHKELIFPHGNDHILPGDEVTIIGEVDAVAAVHTYFGIINKIATSAIIVGGSLVSFHLAKVLTKNGIAVKIIEKDFERCRSLAEQLPRCTILHHDATDYSFFRAEHVEDADLFVACTNKDEVNILAGGLAKEVGCKNVIVPISNAEHMPVVERMGLIHTVSPRISAANKIFTIIQTESVASMVSLYDDAAEVLEIKVTMDSQIVGIPISELASSLPKDFLFAVIQNRGRIIIASGDKILSPGDTVIVISSPNHVEGLQQIF